MIRNRGERLREANRDTNFGFKPLPYLVHITQIRSDLEEERITIKHSRIMNFMDKDLLCKTLDNKSIDV